MANALAKAWNYLMAAGSNKVDELGDPKVQIQQALEDSQRRHQALGEQAAAVIANQHLLEVQLHDAVDKVAKLQGSARQALTMADEAQHSGDQAKAAQFNAAAQTIATNLVTAEENVERLKTLHEQALQSAHQAQTAVQTSAEHLQSQLAERSQLLSQLEQAKMQEQVSSSLKAVSELTASANVPTLDEVRDKIERRYANALGSSELAAQDPSAVTFEVEHAALETAATNRLVDLRKSLGMSAPPAQLPSS